MGSLYSYYDQSTNNLIFHPPNTSPAAFEQLKVMTHVCTYVTDLEAPCFIFHPNQNMDKTKCIVFAHGNGCDIYTMYDFIRRLSGDLGIDVLIFDYPGYGLARNKTSTEQGCYDSIKQVVNYAKTKYAKKWCKLNGYKFIFITDKWFLKNYNECIVIGQPSESKIIKNLKQFKNENKKNKKNRLC